MKNKYSFFLLGISILTINLCTISCSLFSTQKTLSFTIDVSKFISIKNSRAANSANTNLIMEATLYSIEDSSDTNADTTTATDTTASSTTATKLDSITAEPTQNGMIEIEFQNVSVGKNVQIEVALKEINSSSTTTIASGSSEVFTVTEGSQTVPISIELQSSGYSVNHFKQNLDKTYPTEPFATEKLTGKISNETEAVAKEIEGFTADFSQATILADGSTVVSIYYARNTVTVTLDFNGGTSSSSTSMTGLYGATLTVVKPSYTGYIFGGWKDNSGNTLSSITTFPYSNTTYTATWRTYYIVGDTGPAGGTIFYANYDETAKTYTYLEAAPAYLSSKYAWDSNATNLSGLGEAIGKGSANTTLMVQKGSGFEAANACATYTYNSYDDWFMASRQELQQLRTFLTGTVRTTDFYNTFTGSVYFSSSQSEDGSYAYYSYIKGNGNSDSSDGSKKETQNVRPIRLFTGE